MLVIGVAKVKNTREELYDEVWNETLSKVAARHRLSNKGLREVCEKYHIPTPNAVYWLAKHDGQPVEREPLPAWEEPPSETSAVTTAEPEAPSAAPPAPPPAPEP